MRTFRGRDVRRALAAEVVAEAVGPLSPGCELFGLETGGSDGRFDASGR